MYKLGINKTLRFHNTTSIQTVSGFPSSVNLYIYIYIYIYINLPDMSQLPTSPFPKRGTSGPGNVFSTLR